MRPKRSLLGQIFLKDDNYIKKILGHLEVTKRKVLEIGPGDGIFTDFLSSQALKLYCLEFDKYFYKFLKEKFSNISKIKVIHSDVLKFPISRLGKKLIVFGNIPYQISSKLINYLIKYRNSIDKVYFTVQKEFAEKLLAKPFQKQYSFLSCYLQYYAQAKKIFEIPAGAFRPQPKVDSSFIEIEFYRRLPYKAKDENLLFQIIRKAFAERRKKIINALGLKSQNGFRSLLRLKPDFRAESLSLTDYISLANKIYALKIKI